MKQDHLTWLVKTSHDMNSIESSKLCLSGTRKYLVLWSYHYMSKYFILENRFLV